MNNSPENNFNPPWETRQVLLTFLITFIISFFLSLGAAFYLKYLQHLGLIEKFSPKFFVNTIWGDILMLFYFCLLALVGYFYILKKIKGSKLSFFIDFKKIKEDLKYAFGVYLLSFTGVFLLGIVVIAGIVGLAVIFHKDPVLALKFYSEGIEIERTQVTAHLGVLKIILLIFFAPVFEELFFRGCLYGALRKRYGLFRSIFTSSILFALMHGYFFNFVYVFFMGIIAAWIYEKRRSLAAPVFFHFLWNLQVLLVTFAALSKGR